MRDPIRLLETIGADASLTDAGSAELGESPECSGLAPELRAALLAGDLPTLQVLLRAPDVVCCLIDPAEEEDEEDEEEGEEDDDGSDPARKPQPRGSSR